MGIVSQQEKGNENIHSALEVETEHTLKEINKIRTSCRCHNGKKWGFGEEIESLTMDEKPWKLWNMVISRLILKAEKNELIGRTAECFKKETWNT